MPALAENKLPKHLKFDYSWAKTLEEMDEIDGSAESMRELIAGWVYEKWATLEWYEPVEYVNPRRERITMSMPSHNLTRLKILANSKDIPYQTYMNSIIKQHLDESIISYK